MIQTLVDGLDHPEGVAWGPDGHLYAGGEAGQLYRIGVDSRTAVEFASTGGFVLGIALDADGNVYACDNVHAAVMRITPDGVVTKVTSGTADRPMRTPNYPVFDRAGNLYVSDSGDWPDGGGCIYRVAPDGRTEVWSDQVPRFANGLALAPDQSALYAVQSTLPGVTRLPIRPDGTAGEPEPVVTLPDTVPDGLAFDGDGRLYISCYRPDRIYTLETDGELRVFDEDVLGTRIAAPTNIAFGGPDLSSLFVASLGRWHIGVGDVAVPGAPLNYPKLPASR